jgi:hypothetical protein
MPAEKLTIKKLKEIIADLPEDAVIAYHSYYKGCGLAPYLTQDIWLYPKDTPEKAMLVLNPASDHDPRANRKSNYDC